MDSAECLCVLVRSVSERKHNITSVQQIGDKGMLQKWFFARIQLGPSLIETGFTPHVSTFIFISELSGSEQSWKAYEHPARGLLFLGPTSKPAAPSGALQHAATRMPGRIKRHAATGLSAEKRALSPSIRNSLQEVFGHRR